ncbi:Uma2 family endonuclease [Phaeacidiphilus oryzae]|uniref:Uma2 family endonuclease n=1 Tax=Phaeacidiphilus oryzae TaxID=348818 RepID=UPI0005663DB3|nr:Uma2 family endonuclease [Phaeacidiphilus oryzae]
MDTELETRTQIYRRLRELADHFYEHPAPGMDRRAEIADGQLVMMMSPSGRHDYNIVQIQKQLTRQLADELAAATVGDVEDPANGLLRRPDLLVLPIDALDPPDDDGVDAERDHRIDAHAVILAVEIVSPSNPGNDHRTKVADYARMGIEHYLIVDPRTGTLRYLWGIRDHAYVNTIEHSFGETITVGDGWKIDTTAVRRYRSTT